MMLFDILQKSWDFPSIDCWLVSFLIVWQNSDIATIIITAIPSHLKMVLVASVVVNSTMFRHF